MPCFKCVTWTRVWYSERYHQIEDSRFWGKAFYAILCGRRTFSLQMNVRALCWEHLKKMSWHQSRQMAQSLYQLVYKRHYIAGWIFKSIHLMSKNVEPLWKAVSKKIENERKNLEIYDKNWQNELISRRDVQYVWIGTKLGGKITDHPSTRTPFNRICFCEFVDEPIHHQFWSKRFETRSIQ